MFFVKQGDTVNQEKYIEILDKNLYNWSISLYPDGCFSFWQDNAPCHKGKTTMKWLQDYIPPLIQVPAHSPDLNPIELIWGIMKTRIQKEYPSNLKIFL